MPSKRTCHGLIVLLGLVMPFNNIQAEDIERIEDTSIPVAELLAEKMAPRLIKDQTQTIFLSASGCSVQPLEKSPGASGSSSAPDDQAWCNAFWSSLETALVSKSIRFLPEATRDQIREKIANEQVYQNSSLQVDPDKAVALGKQKVFQAFVSVSVSRSAAGQIIARANSINIKEGTVNISETVKASLKYERVRPWSIAIAGSSGMLLGLASTAGFLLASERARDRSSAAYSQYKEATTTEKAIQMRQKTEKADKEIVYYNVGAGLGGCLALYSAWKYWTVAEDSYVLNILVHNDKTNMVKPNKWVWNAEVMSNDSFGLGIQFSF